MRQLTSVTRVQLRQGQNLQFSNANCFPNYNKQEVQFNLRVLPAPLPLH
jgi:hypothetical protein